MSLELQRFLDSPLLAAASCLDEPAVLGAKHTWTWRHVHEASIALSQHFGDATAVLNLCTSRASFLVVWLAALRGRHLLILPPSGGGADLAAVMQAQASALIVVDNPHAVPEPWRQNALVVGALERQPAPATAAELAWQPAWDDTAVRLYTSGSTGAPEPQPKSLRQLATGAWMLGARLAQEVDGGLAAIERIVCSVPPQHMFGVECSVMLPLLHALPVFDGRPLLPADVRAAFADAAPAAWIATPLHLRSLVLAGDPLANCRVVIASTMPLTQTLAQQTERLVAAPVVEIYGSTETGVLATRRTAQETLWHCLQGVRFESIDATTQASGPHFASPQTLPDQIDTAADGRFTWRGRRGDLIKIAGRRASFAGLNGLLQEMPGLQDGVFYLPATGHPTERLCLMYEGPLLERAAMERWLRARLDPVFLPRTLIHVERLPRADNGKLSQPALDQVFQQWQAADDSRFAVPQDHPALAGHFPGRPIVPGALLLDQVLTQLSAAMGRPVARLQQVKFTAALLPEEMARVAFDRTGPRVRFSVTTLRDGAAVVLASGRVVLVESAEAAG